MPHRLAESQVGHAGLGRHAPVGEIYVRDFVELAHPQDDAVGQGQGAAGQGSAGAPRHHLDIQPGAQLQHLGDLGRRLRQHRQHGGLPVGGQGVSLVGPQGRLIHNHAGFGKNRPELAD